MIDRDTYLTIALLCLVSLTYLLSSPIDKINIEYQEECDLKVIDGITQEINCQNNLVSYDYKWWSVSLRLVLISIVGVCAYMGLIREDKKK